MDKVAGKTAITYSIADGASALMTKNRIAFNWFRADGSRSEYSSNEEIRRECIEEIERDWQEKRQYL